MSAIARRAVVSGRVQGVGFRYSCRDRAQSLGVSGWVRNRSDGTVELVAEGEPDAVEALLDWCRTGPPHATVAEVDVEHHAVTGGDGFRIVR